MNKNQIILCRFLPVLFTFHFSLFTSRAQCGIENTAFKSGEELAYDLYFNWKFIWVKVGTAEMDTKMAKFEGKDAWKSYLITRGNPKLDKFFIMRDTLLSYCNPDLSPLYFRKGAQEGDSYYVDEIWYSYPHGNCQLKKHRITSSGEHLWKTTTYKSCIYDMMSIFLRARNFDASKMKKNETIPMPVSDAMGLSKRFWVTDDDNHIPVRLDMFLSFGSAKAYLKSYKGIRSPMTAKIK